MQPRGAGKSPDEKHPAPLPEKGRACWILFCSMLYISAFTFGGGFVIVTFMKRRFVDQLRWLEEQEMLDMTALAQSAPGPIAVNAAIQVGWKVAGFAGMLSAVFGTILPPMVIFSVISLFYQRFAANRYVAYALKGMQSGVAAVILDVAVSLAVKVVRSKEWIHCMVMAAAFAAAFFLKANVIWIILAAALVGIFLALLRRKGGTAA
ncbi:MAG: chromate transporter [Clostridia bacterium]|nr:chromate transporter [Clostridia bacterium]